MKKISTLFVAALLSVAMFADKSVYLKLSSDWAGYPAKYAVYYYESGVGDGWSDFMTKVENEVNVYTTTVPSEGYSKIIFVRLNGAATETNWDNKWSQTIDLDYPTGENAMFTVTSGGTGSECNGEWSVYAPEDPAKFYITGILGEWNPDAIKSTTDSYTVENVPAGHHAMKVTVDGTWGTVKGLEQISESNKYLYPDQDGNVCFSLSETANVTVTYIAGEPEVFTVSSDKFTVPSVKLVGEGEAFGNWNEANAIVFADNNEESASHTFTLARDQHVIFKMIRGGDWLSKIGEDNTNFGLNRAFTTTSDFTRPGEGETPSLELSADLAGEYTLTWTYATGELKVTFPEPTLVNGFYLVGDFNGTPAWNVEDLTADKIFVWNKNIGEGNEEWKVTVDLHAGDEFKACYVYMDQITEYIPANAEEKYYVDNNHAGNGKTIYFQQKYNMEWGGHFYVEATTPTAVENTQVADKVVKCIENGQLIIVRDGVQYNVLGGVVR